MAQLFEQKLLQGHTILPTKTGLQQLGCSSFRKEVSYILISMMILKKQLDKSLAALSDFINFNKIIAYTSQLWNLLCN